MKTILIHFGAHKTGSTTLQKTFSQNRTTLRAQGIAFPWQSNFHQILYSAFLSRPMSFDWNKRLGLSRKEVRARDRAFLNKLDQRIRKSPAKTIILSSEYLSNLNPEKIPLVKAHFEQFGRVHACYFYRELHPWISSFSQQLAKGGELSRPLSSGPGLRRMYDVPLTLQSVFGEAGVTFLKFEESLSAGVCSTFLSTFGLPDLDQMGVAEVRANTGISAHAVQALYLYNALFPRRSAERSQELVEQLKTLPGPRYRTPGFTQAEIADYAEKRQIVQARLGLRLAAPESLPQYPEPDALSVGLDAQGNVPEAAGQSSRLLPQ